jgi:glycolate oxidase FAD binding subunit
MEHGSGGARMIATATTDTIRERIRDAESRGKTVRVTGRGTWLDANRPVRASEIVSTRELTGIVEYVPGDLTLTARAGTTLEEIAAATAEHNQWLAIDPHGSPDGTLGATAATASFGPLVTAFGTPRDLVLGLEFVSGRGMVARGGGRVVKNVAGFDLTRLLVGSWGSLGIITEVTVRLHARPETDVTVTVKLPNRETAAGDVRRFLRRASFAPDACEVLHDGAALFRLGGNAEAVTAQRTALNELGAAAETDPSAWADLRRAEPKDAIVFRFSRHPSEMDRTWADARRVVAGCAGVFMHATPAKGIVRVIMPRTDTNAAALRNSLKQTRDLPNRMGERLPADLWPAFTTPAASDELSIRVKSAFDPRRLLNPGILGEQA